MSTKKANTYHPREIEQADELYQKIKRDASEFVPLENPYLELNPERILGVYENNHPGPTVVCTGGVHGNEPAALHAIRAVIQLLHKRRPAFRGKLIGLGGNLPALAQSQRYIDADLNRIWTSERMKLIREQKLPQPPFVETNEQLELYCIIAGLMRETEHLFLMDLHTTSSKSAPFLVLNDAPEYRSYAKALPVPVIFGLSDELEGTLIHWIKRKGSESIAFEAGQHYARTSMDNHIAAILQTLVIKGCLLPQCLPELEDHRKVLRESAKGTARHYQLAYHYKIAPDEKFAMNPGYISFQKVRKGEELARNQNGPILCPMDGTIFMPLYQTQGNDGFFIVKAE
ncbi:MAG: succinylglutamate desuccinylase/aspartoacylase family protein [Calditrichia bacterium]